MNLRAPFFWALTASVILLVQGCATSNVSYKKTEIVSSKQKNSKPRSLTPKLSENFELEGSDLDSDEYVKRRGNKARGTHDY